RDHRLAVAVAVLAVAVLADGLPVLGADLGGAVALVPAAAVVVLILGRWPITWARAAAVAAGTVAVVVAFALVDLARPAAHRTHLGRFAAQLLDGDGGEIVRRKAVANWNVLTSSVWTLLLPLVVVGLAVVAVKARPVARLRGGVIGLQAGL